MVKCYANTSLYNSSISSHISANLLWVKRLAAETAMKRLRAKLDAVAAQFPLEGEAEKSQRKINDRAIV